MAVPTGLLQPQHFLARIEAPHFVAGLIFKDGVCVQAAPILYKKAIGRTARELKADFDLLRWRAKIISRW